MRTAIILYVLASIGKFAPLLWTLALDGMLVSRIQMLPSDAVVVALKQDVDAAPPVQAPYVTPDRWTDGESLLYAHQLMSVNWLMSIGSWNVRAAHSSPDATTVCAPGAVTDCASAQDGSQS